MFDDVDVDIDADADSEDVFLLNNDGADVYHL